MKILLTPFMILAGIGLFLSIMVQVSLCSVCRLPLATGHGPLRTGFFVVWLPAMLVFPRLGKDFGQVGSRKVALRGGPQWMQYMTFFFLGCAILNFLIFFALEVGRGAANETDGDTPTAVLRGASGHWMAFYSAALAILYSAAHLRDHDDARSG